MSIKEEGGLGTTVRRKERLKHPKQYKVLLLNDDFTPMDFVVRLLEEVFEKVPAEAVQIMLQIHNKGSGLCGIFSREIAEAKIEAVHKLAKGHGHPLRATMEVA